MKMKEIKKKGQGFNTLLYGAAVVGVLIILLSLFAVLNNSFRADLEPDSTAANITVDGDEGLQEMSSQTSTIMLVLAFSVVLALIIAVVVIVRRIQQ